MLRKVIDWLSRRRIWSCLSLTPVDANPMPWKIISICAFTLFNAVLHMTLFFPFQAQMLRYFGFKEENIGKAIWLLDIVN